MSLNKIFINNFDTNYTHSIFDITQHTGISYENLSDALAAVPDGKKSGGMTIRYVQTSDNKYVQFRCIADEFTTDVTKWAIADEGVYVENPEFVEVHTDAEDRVLYGVKRNGDFYYGAGVPSQIKEEIDTIRDETEEDINNKVDKKIGKSLIDAEFASSQSTIDNPEFLEVTADSENKPLEAISREGRKVIYIPIDIPAASFASIDNKEWLDVVLDVDGRVLEGMKKNGDKVFGKMPNQIIEYIDNYFKNSHNLPIVVGGTNPNNSYLIVGRGNTGGNQPYCVAIGIDVMTNNTGIKNMTVGEDNLADCTGHDNTSMGYHALFRSTSGNANAGFASEALDDNTTGSYNTGIGFCSLQRNNSGSYNVAVGSFALRGGKEGTHFDPNNPKSFNRNIAIGVNTLGESLSGTNDNIAIGHGTLLTEKVYKNNIAIGNGADCDKDYQTVIGNDSTVETILRGDLIVMGIDGKKRQIVFNNDNTCSWLLVEENV